MALSHPSPPEPAPIAIRRCTTHTEYRACVDLQVAVWNFDPIDVVSHHLIVVAAETGGQIFGAYDGGRLVGFALSFAAVRHGRPYLHSHMAAVVAEYQGRGIGRRLKLAQREDAIARGIERIEWTFDPLEIRNAYFNIARLGAVIRRYIPDFYGGSSSPLHANLPTDRLVAEWELTSARVIDRVAGRGAGVPSGPAITVPSNIAELRRAQPARAAEIQARMREEFSRSFAQGRSVVGFRVDEAGGHYILGQIV